MNSTPPDDVRELMTRALQRLKDAERRIRELESAAHAPVAVVGMACRLPGGVGDPEACWELLRAGRDATSDVPSDRWDPDAHFDPDPAAPGRIATRRGAFLSTIDQFDPLFFGISPREAAWIDPQQRLLLEASWEAIEDAGIAPTALRGRKVGVFVGISTHDYANLIIDHLPKERISGFSGTGTAHSAASGRIAFTLGLTGPCLSVDTACSSALLAVHLACESLRRGECELAIAGGANVIASPISSLVFSQAQMLSPDGRSKAFSADADGYGRGEGCGVVVLRRAVDARAGGDRIRAEIVGSATNQDGASSGLTVPSGPAQAEVIRLALAAADVPPERISYVEAHGTGTALGDPIELNALGQVFGGRAPADRVVVGSIKTNVGHLESAAGIAGLIKVVLQLEQRQIAPHLHCARPTAHVDWNELPLRVPATLEPWKAPPGLRHAGVCAFSFSGTNVHVVLREAATAHVDGAADGPDVFTLAARTPEALRRWCGAIADHLTASPGVSTADACTSARRRSGAFKARVDVAVVDRSDLVAKLRALALGGEFPPPALADAPRGGGRVVSLPHHPFDRQRCWLDLAPSVVKPRHAPSATPSDHVYTLRWEILPPVTRGSANGLWVVAGGMGDEGAIIADGLRARGARAVRVAAGDPWPKAPVRGVVFCSALDGPTGVDADAHMDRQSLICGDLLAVMRQLADGGEGIRLVLVTHRAVAADAGDRIDVAGSTAWGLGRVTAAEYPTIDCRLVDVDVVTTPALLDEIVASGQESEVAIRGTKRFGPRLDRLTERADDDDGPFGRGPVIVTGGTGAVGLHLADHLAAQGVKRLVLVARSKLAPDAEVRVTELRGRGVRVEVRQADVVDAAAVRALFEWVRSAMGAITGVVHAAGVLDDGVIGEQTWKRFERVLAPKVAGTWNLHENAADSGVRMFLCVSSTAALLGSPGQANYAAANAFMHAVVHARRSVGLRSVVVDFGPWAGGGMAGRSLAAKQRFSDSGIRPLDPAEMCAALDRVLALDLPQAAVTSVDWTRLARSWQSAARMPVLRRLCTPSAATRPTDVSADFLAEIERLPDATRSVRVGGRVRELVADVLRAPAHALRPEQALGELGLDSLLAVELRNRIRSAIGASVALSDVAGDRTIAGLSDAVLSNLRAPQPLPATVDDALLREIENLTDAEARRLLESPPDDG